MTTTQQNNQIVGDCGNTMTNSRRRRGESAILIWIVLLILMLSTCCARIRSGDLGGVWPQTSRSEVEPLGHPTIESRLQEITWDVNSGFRFVVFGDQRALADGEWQRLMVHVSRAASGDEHILFMLDSGDIVDNGEFSDQFAMLRQILEPAGEIPYLVGVGDHELHDNRPGGAREHTASFLRYLDPSFSPGRMYYHKDIGRVRFIFLDTTDLLRR